MTGNVEDTASRRALSGLHIGITGKIADKLKPIDIHSQYISPRQGNGLAKPQRQVNILAAKICRRQRAQSYRVQHNFFHQYPSHP
jgi:hypothetical protein